MVHIEATDNDGNIIGSWDRNYAGDLIEPTQLRHLQDQCQDDSERWFPSTTNNLAFITLALCGEVGELANEVKKVLRGSQDINDPEVRSKVVEEAADVFTYLVNFFNAMKADMGAAYDLKREKNCDRWGYPAAECGAPSGDDGGVRSTEGTSVE